MSIYDVIKCNKPDGNFDDHAIGMILHESDHQMECNSGFTRSH
jgi:hypothetical protein